MQSNQNGQALLDESRPDLLIIPFNDWLAELEADGMVWDYRWDSLDEEMDYLDTILNERWADLGGDVAGDDRFNELLGFKAVLMDDIELVESFRTMTI